ncbi:hypothetical protein EX895_002996 [Sporisorium graminicola]|uniref:Radical SAM core domain-containing protein n=1 Tax=Sporisorium graminicola TaxID=280036 RepID=A0A4U7KTR9_9BASI|nr:hypothetical protein EX895_002996 [Sporisorium graminicola]TKY87900.1 hypothetical protein EX895_002996 [Sporisorium graminicola]
MISASGIKPLLEERAPWLDAENYTAAAQVFPMRANNYVVDQLIDWQQVPNDPIFRLVFPQPEMLEPEQLDRIKLALRAKASGPVLRSLAEQIRQTLNPHPSNQKTENVPVDLATGATLAGVQHKYRETVLFFPMEGQFCHSFCTYCFRWAQFTAVGSGQGFQSKDVEKLTNHLAASPDVSDLLFTGGDPMVMKTHHWENYLDPILNDPRLGHIATIRIGTKSLAYWPERFVNDADAASTLDLFRRVIQSGRQVSIMAHFSHAVELETPLVREAIRRIRATGAQIRCQAPLIRGINDDPAVWSKMWRTQTQLGLIPYYMFVERDTGAKHFFEVPLEKAFDIYKQASSSVAGTARTANGPSMSASPGKIQVVGICELPSPTPGAGATRPGHEKVFVLRFLQGRNPDWCRETIFARFDPKASWFDELKPAFGEARWFFEQEYNELRSTSAELGSSGQRFATSFAGRDRAGIAASAVGIGAQSKSMAAMSSQ